MKTNPLFQLSELGQSVWFDNIQRTMLHSGELARMAEEDDLRGVTSNPTIFEKAINGSDAYDEALIQLARDHPDLSSRDYFFALAIEDIQTAADIMRPVYDRTDGRDGMISLEVSPYLAHDSEASISEARHLFAQLDRPNVMIKIPSTAAGVPVVEQLIADGINVNATLLFSVERYKEIAQAYLRGLATRQGRGKSIDHVNSVASFFVSRVDTLFDKKLTALLSSTEHSHHEEILSLKGSIGIANAKAAYLEYKKLFNSEEFKTLEASGARTQRLLWASTGTKNSLYSDVLYIESLIGRDTVNTIPPATYTAFKDHGKAEPTLERHAYLGREKLVALRRLGIDIDAAMRQLEQEGVAAFAESFDSLLHAIEDKVVRLKGAA